MMSEPARISRLLRARGAVLVAAAALAGVAAGAPEPEDATPEEVRSPRPVVHAAVDGIIHPLTAEYMAETIEHADQVGAAAVVIELNTPGGLLDSTRDVTQAILGARTPVVVFVSPSGAQAASAGFFILMAADVAAMAPGTNTGAAHPVGGQGETIEGDLGEKIEQDAAATIRSLAQQHGRNVELAEKAVTESLSFSAEEALERGLIDVVADGVPSLLRAIDGRKVDKVNTEEMVLETAGAVVERREMRRIQRFLAVIAHPQIALLLMSFGMLGLYVEMTHPGLIFPGVAGAICLILGFFALSVLPVSYAGVALILLALALFVAEFFVVSYGLLTAGGAIAMILGGLLLYRTPDPALRVDLRLILGLTGGMVLLVSLLLVRAIQIRRQKVLTGKEGLIGEIGVARSELAPAGKIFVHGELWRARSEQPIAAGTEVEVVAVDGLELRVRPAAATSRAPEGPIESPQHVENV
ncbi:MAG: nodulation protein NfeD [Acidobacteria bacterium]|nr:MAG: nodulation protein NfeD [Acidobacteriota bacterium]